MEVGTHRAARSRGELRAKPDATQAAEEAAEEELMRIEDLDMPHLEKIATIYVGDREALDADPEVISASDTVNQLLVKNNGGVEVDDEEYLKQELERLRTGEDAIAFFARNGTLAKTRLLYCNRAAPSEDDSFQPYDLVLVPEDMRHAEYFTVSSTGIVHVQPGQLSECISLTDWMRQSLMYRVLTSMSFFRYYIHRKVFEQWRINARYEVYCSCRRRLASSCFLSKPLFVEPLVQVHGLIHEVEEVKVMQIDQACYHLGHFADTQNQVRSNPATGAQKEFEQKHDAVVVLLDRLIATVNRSIDHDPTAVGDFSKNKSKSMVQEKLEAQQRARHQRIAREDASMLGDCIRLVDHMFQSALVKVVLSACQDFLQRVESAQKLFFISVGFEERHVKLEPQIEDFEDTLKQVWEGTLGVVNQVPSFSSVRQYEAYTRVVNHQAVRDVLLDNVSYNKYTSLIQKAINENIDKTQVYANDQYEPFRRIYQFGKDWSDDEYLDQEHSYDDLYADMSKMWEYQEDLEKFRAHHMLGIISVDGKGLRGELAPIPEQALNAMKRVLLKMSQEKTREALEKFDSTNKQLDERPSELSKFATYVQTYASVEQERPEMEELMDEVDTMYALLKRSKVKLSLDDQLAEDRLKTQEHDFSHTKMLEAKRYIDEQQAAMAEETYQRSLEVEEKMQSVTAELKEGAFIDAEKIPYAHEVLEELEKIGEKQVKYFEERASTYAEYEELLGSTPQVPAGETFNFEELDKGKKLYQQKLQLWTLADQWQTQSHNWLNSDFVKVDVEDLNKQVNASNKTAFALVKALDGDEVASRMKSMVDEFREKVPAIMDLGNPAMRPRHWEKLFKKVSLPWKGPSSASNISLSQLEGNGIFDHKEFIAEVSANASGEAGLEASLDAIITAWADLPLPILNHRNQRDLWILGDLADVITLCEDHSVSIGTMMGSRFVQGVRDKVEVWEKKINMASDVIDEWYQVQRAWMYLENIFSAEDIQQQLPSEAAKFKQVDKFWKDLFRKVRQSYKNSMDAFQIPDLLNRLKWANDTLDHVQKKLEAYLETKRAAFPRFYFLSNDELLSILSQTRNPQAVQEHMSKCFDSINRVVFEGANIIGMMDMIKENVPFVEPVITGPVVEKWLSEVEVAMVNGLYAITKETLELYPEDGTDRTTWLLEGGSAVSSQAQLLVDQVHWTRLAEIALDKINSGENANAMKDNIEFHQKQLVNSVSIVRMKLTKLQRVLMGALIVLDVHGITVLENLVETACSSIHEFDWSKQLRYYWVGEDGAVTSQGDTVSDDCVCKQTIACFKYSYEYLGNTPRLVVTPLTDKCYMTLTGAMHLNYGGAPAGPAGTGKTETTKDLGKALAVPIVVFNCSDGLDYKIMGRFFSGLAQAGAWACFDEFNRIQVEVLSVIAQQMLTVTQAIRARKETFEFVGNEIPLNRRFGVYITMNPGYAGRAELPDNLKALFRPVAMMVPDYGLIAEIILYSEGFNAAKLLARKMVNLYRLSSEQLSKQDHYDFGMRAVKSVLVMAGHLKRQNPDLEENVTLIRALRDSNAPKFLSFDLPLFGGIISDLYPEVTIPNVDYGKLKEELERQLRLTGLQIVPAFVTKITQLLETQLVRHGVMLVGLTMTGKSTDCTILAKTLTQLKKDGSTDAAHQLTKIFNLNPKSITIEELYGSFNENTGEWKDGLTAILVREAVSDSSDNKKWINFDGPVDAIWIENMNTVLDDNKMLCLANGERIKLPPSMTIMFEVNDLQVASPATVSRCGMVYLEPVHLGWKPQIESWTEKFEAKYPHLAKSLGKWATDICTVAIPFIREECAEAPGIPSMDANLVQGYLRMMNTFISEAHMIVPLVEGEEGRKPVKSEADEMKLAAIYCAMSAIWSLGANLHEKSRKKFMTFIVPHLAKICPQLPSDGDLYMMCVRDEDCTVIELASIVPSFSFDINEPFFNILVPTAETTGQRMLLENLMQAGYSALFSGETGVGKSVGIQMFLNTCGERYATATANFSAQTSTSNVVDLLENRLERKRKNLLGAPPGKTMLYFVDDINMPMLEFYGAQPPIELLRQVIDYGGFYDKKKLFWKAVADTQFIAACGPPGGGRMTVTPRLFRHFNMLWMPNLSLEAMNQILSSILGGWLGAVKPEIEGVAEPVVKAAVDMFFKITNDLLPTPVKCHYTFNLRDPAKVVQGMLMVNVKKGVANEQGLINLFLHEMSRQFRDRLIDDKDRDWFDTTLAEKLTTHTSKKTTPEAFRELIFGDFLDRAERPYEPVDGQEKCVEIFQEWLEDYNQTNPTKMDIVFFKDACNHLARCTRTIRQPRGNMLLVGVSGVGRKSVARIGAHMADYQCFSIEITRSYDANAFKEDIKSMMMGVAKSGGKGMMFLFSDTQIVKESFLEDINNILNTGEVPNLFAPDEAEQVIGLMRPVAKAAGKPESRDGIWQHFVQVIRENLHIVLAFSPVGEGFRGRCRQFPSIINCATIDWYSPWPVDALYAVAERSYRAAPKELALEDLIPQLSTISGLMHSSSKEAAEQFFESLKRRTYMTPTSYLELIGLFVDLVGKKRGEITTKLERYKVGVKTLNETKVVVDDLKVQLTKMQPEIEQAKKDTAQLMIQVEKDQVIAKEKSDSCAVDEAAASAAAKEANEIKDDCQKDLDEALPEYYSAIKSLDALDKKDIQEVKSFAKPPALVEFTLCAVCLLLGAKETWDDAKKQMNDSNFLSNLKNYDKDALAGNKQLTKKLQKYLGNPDFTAEKVQSVSKAAMSLCMWVRAMDVYGRVAREIEPKKEKLKGAEAAEAEASEKLRIAKSELRVVLDNVAALEAKLDGAKKKAAQLEKDAEDCVLKLGRAEKLLEGLGNESVRWDAASTVLEKNLKYVVGNIVLAGGFIAYTGPFTSEFRRDLIKQWLAKSQELNLDTDPTWKAADVLVDPAEVRSWNIHGLPSDDLSVENGLMVTRGRRWPLMIDPQGQANRWVRNMGKEKNITITKLSDGMYLRKLEACIRNGCALLIENVEEVLDPALEPVLTKAIFKRGGQLTLRLGDTDVPYSEDFAFYITSKMANPHYLPEVCIKVTIINFTVTLLGLEEQLVAEVVASERPDLAQQRTELVVQIAADKKTQDDLEQLILKLLAEAGGDVLKDDTLITTLDKSKTTGGEIKERMVVADKAMVEIDRVREELRPVATRSSILYFVVADLANIDPMYQYSLEYFVTLFQDRLRDSEKADDVNQRIAILIDDFTRFIFLNICRGLFEDHKLLFSFLITIQILRNNTHSAFLGKKPITTSEWLFFLRGFEAGKGVLPDDHEDPPAPAWVGKESWKKLSVLQRLTEANGSSEFSGLLDAIAGGKEWETFCQADDINARPFPKDFAGKLSAFQQMIVVKSIKENLLTLVARNVVSNELGKLYIESPPFDLASCFNDSKNVMPLIFVLSAGADPTESLLSLAADKGYTERLHFISLGQGQGPKAEQLVKMGWETGDWVCLQNCHLAASWMGKLEAIQESQDPAKISEDYRLWLTSMPSPTFPVPVLQGGVKITNEPPKGLRANVGRTFMDMTEDAFESCPTKPMEYKKLLFGLAFFHAVILERRKFGPIGWNIPYEWMDSDFQVSREQVRMYLVSQPDVPWITLRYIIAEVNYGGRVTDDKDVRLISSLLKGYFCPEMFKPEFRFAGLAEYYPPAEGSLEETQKYVKGLPMDEDPRVFGLHPNALITAQQDQARKFIDTIVSVQPRISSGGVGKKPEEIASEIAEGFLNIIPDAEKPKNAHASTYQKIAGGGIISIGVFHSQEYDRLSNMIKTVKSSLRTLIKAIQGIVLMSADMEGMFNAFLVQKVPGNWQKVAYPCLKPLASWVTDFIERIKFMVGWLLQGPPTSFWVPCFFFPQGFMTAALQLHARKTKIPIDTLEFFSAVSKCTNAAEAEMPESGVNIHGLFLQGCGWDVPNARLKESEKDVLFEQMPVIWLEPVGNTDIPKRIAERNLYMCPIYKTSERKGVLSTTGHSTNFVKYFPLGQSEPDAAFWVCRGVAMLCMLDD
jgi:dynein heavy chain